jgi:hypothetical protein
MYAILERSGGAAGIVAVNLFRAQKCSARAKVYRGGNGHGSFRSQAYERKNWSMGNLCKVLAEHAAGLGIVWGWKIDPAQEFHNWVLYIDLPDVGQVSFHSASPLSPERYAGDWDHTHLSAERIIRYVDSILAACPADQPQTT